MVFLGGFSTCHNFFSGCFWSIHRFLYWVVACEPKLWRNLKDYLKVSLLWTDDVWWVFVTMQFSTSWITQFSHTLLVGECVQSLCIYMNCRRQQIMHEIMHSFNSYLVICRLSWEDGFQSFFHIQYKFQFTNFFDFPIVSSHD